MNEKQSLYNHFRRIASRPGNTRPFIVEKLRVLGRELGLSPKQIDLDIQGPTPPISLPDRRNLSQAEAQEISRSWGFDISAGFKVAPDGVPLTIGPYINVRLRREVHRIVMVNAQSHGLSISKYLAWREGLIDLPGGPGENRREP